MTWEEYCNGCASKPLPGLQGKGVPDGKRTEGVRHCGNTISDRNELLRSTRICKELTRKHGLHIANGKDNVKRERLKEPDRIKYELYDILKTEVGRCGNWDVLVANLNRQGVEVRFKHKGQTDEIQGVVFTKNGYHFNGSKVDRRFSYSKINAALQCNRYKERMELASETKTPCFRNAQCIVTVPHWTRRVFQRLIRIAERQFFLQRRRCGSQSGNAGDSSQEEET